MPATHLSPLEDQSALVHRFTVERPVAGRELIDTDDAARDAILAWIDEPANGAVGLHGMLNFVHREGKGYVYVWGFSDPTTAARFAAHFGTRETADA